MWPFYFIFLAICFLAFVDTKPHKTTYLFLFGLLVVFAGFRGNIGNDYEIYTGYYNMINFSSNEVLVEPSYIVISHLVHSLFNNILYVFIIYAILGVGITFLAIKKISEFQIFSILVYFSYSFLVHEMTQIRAGVASGLFLLSFPAIKERKLKTFLLFIGIAALFHYSILIVLPFYFLNTKKINFVYYFLIPIAYIIYFSQINISSLLQFINIEYIVIKFGLYKSMNKQINVFNAYQLLRVCLIGLFLWKWSLLQTANEYGVLFIKFYIFSAFAFVIFADIPDFGFRISEVFGIVDFMLIPLLISMFKNKIIGKSAVIFISLINIFVLLYYSELFNKYF
jgi:hypothetical protein